MTQCRKKWCRARCQQSNRPVAVTQRSSSARYRPWPFHCGTDPDAVLLRDMAGLSEAAAAQAMGVSTGAVKRYTRDGRRALRVLLDSDQPGPGRNDQA